MAGFFGLFGGKTKYVDEVTDYAQEPENTEPFFLPPDEAKTLGNIDFMRKPNTIKRSFPKTLKGKGKEIVKSISSLEEKAVDPNSMQPKTIAQSNPSPSNGRSENRSVDGNLDMFRKMAKEIKK